MPGVDVIAGKIAAFAVTPQFLIDLMKYGIDAAKVVANPLPEDAKFISVHVDYDLIWIIVQSDSFEYVGPNEMIPQLEKTVFTKVVQ